MRREGAWIRGLGGSAWAMPWQAPGNRIDGFSTLPPQQANTGLAGDPFPPQQANTGLAGDPFPPQQANTGLAGDPFAANGFCGCSRDEAG